MPSTRSLDLEGIFRRSTPSGQDVTAASAQQREEMERIRRLLREGTSDRVYSETTPAAPPSPPVYQYGARDEFADTGEAVTADETEREESVGEIIGRSTAEYSRSAGKMFSNGCIGIELELEGLTSTECPSSWALTRDGSLREGGLEFILRRPTSGTALYQAIIDLERSLTNNTFTMSERCSTHVHVDVTDLTKGQLRNFLACSILFEHVFINLFGQGRDSNTFCLPVDCNAMMFSHLVDLFAGHSLFRGGRAPKYCATGLYRLRDLGTVEFRMFRPMVTSEEMLSVVNFLLKMKEFSKGLESPQDLIEFKKSQDLEQIFVECFGGDYYNQGLEHYIERGIQTLNDVLMSADVTSRIESRCADIDRDIETLSQTRQFLQRGLPDY